MKIAPGTGGPVGVIEAGLKKAGRRLRRTNVVLLILILTVSSLVPLALDGGSKMSGAIINSNDNPSSNPATSTDQTSDPSDPTSTPDSSSPSSGSTDATDSSGTSVPNLSGDGSIATGVLSSNVSASNNGGTYVVYSENYKIVIAQSGNSVLYTIKPYFTNDVPSGTPSMPSAGSRAATGSRSKRAR
jgi:hypothetical protein